jgi:hypothetical protein
MLIGICGKPNAGKSTFFSAATLVDVKIASYPFTTIDPNKGITYVRSPCPHVGIGAQCNPKNSKCEDGTRLIPMNLMDVAGLVPGAHTGKGLGNKFLDDLREADALIQIIDLSGKTDLEGRSCEWCDPADEISFLEEEISHWIAGIIKKHKDKIRGKGLEGLADALTGLNMTVDEVKNIVEKLGLEKERVSWSDDEILLFAGEIRKLSKPIVVAANKSDLPGARENLERLRERFPEKLIIPCSAAAELALRKAHEKGVISYVPGDNKFTITGNADEKQRKALERLGEIIAAEGSGVQRVIDEAAFNLLGLIVVYPVEDENKFSDHFGNVLPHAILLEKGKTPIDLAGKVHTDLAKNFICAINARTKMKVGKDYVLQKNDIIKIVANA